jgi:hypothetical protein
MLKAFHVSDEELWCADSAEEAAADYLEETGEQCADGYPCELTDEELDAEQPEFDENECQTGGKTSARKWLAEMTAPGFLAGPIS